MIACIPPTLEGWVYIIPIHGPLDGPLYTWAQYTPTVCPYLLLKEIATNYFLMYN